MATISTLAVNLIARTSVFERGMKRSRKSMGRFQKSTVATTAKLAAFTGGLLASGGAILALKSFTNAASRAQETMNLFNTVFAENSAETAKWANDFAKNIGRSKTEVKEWAATLQDTFVPLGFARARAAELSKTLVELAVDVASFKNIASDREVIDSFTSAIVGNHRAVRAYGVVLTNATIEAAAMKAGMNKTFTQLTELEKVQLRYNIILASTKDAQGDAAKTATNYANRVKKLKGQFTDLKESMGKELMPVMSRVIGFIDREGVPALQKMARGFNVLIKFLQSNTVKYLAMSTAIVFTIAKIKALIGVVKAIANSYRVFAIAQSVVLSLQGPKGWITLAVGVAVATAAIISLNNAMKDTQSIAEKIPAKRQSIIDAAGVNVDELRAEVARKEAFIERLKTSTVKVAEAGRNRAIASAEKSLRISKSHLVTAIQERRAVQDIAQAEQDRLAQNERNKAGIEGISSFISDLQDRVDTVGLSDLEAQMLQLEKVRDGLEGNAWIEFNRGLLEADSLIAELLEKEKLLEDVKLKDPIADLPSGRFQEIRSEFIDVAALNAGGSTKGVNKTNELMQKSIFIQQQTLTEIKGTAVL